MGFIDFSTNREFEQTSYTPQTTQLPFFKWRVQLVKIGQSVIKVVMYN